MKKRIVTSIALFSIIGSSFAGGLLTNTNQSAHFIRNPARDASTEIDAVYTNPAGTAFLTDGFQLAITNQSVWQTRTIDATFAPFAGFGGNATKQFVGTAEAPVVPSIQLAYKTGKLSLSAGFAISGGGGKATFANGLPSFEAPISMLPLGLNSKVPTSKYSVDGYMEGKQFIYGAQINAAYKLTDYLSIAVGVRANIVDNSYNGHLTNIMINPTHPTINPTGALMSANTFFKAAATGATQAATSLTALETAGMGSKTLSELVALNVITATQKAQLAGGLGVTDITVSAGKVGYTTLAATNNAYASATADKYVDCVQSGFGITPIIGVNYNSELFNIGAKYEFLTKLKIENNTKVDDTGQFTHGVNTPNDIPALFTIGADVKLMKRLKLSAGFHHFFDSDASMAKIKVVENGQVVEKGKENYINGGVTEYLAGAEFDLTKKLMISAGGQITRTGATDAYQSDMSNSLNSYSIGFGGAYRINEKLRLNMGYFFTNYEDWTKVSTNYNGTTLAGTDVYSRTNKVFSIGLDWKF